MRVPTIRVTTEQATPTRRGSLFREDPERSQRGQRRNDDPPDFADEQTIETPEGEYPRIISYDQIVKVEYDIDTGQEVVEARSPAENIAIVATDVTPPSPQVRYAGQLRVTPKGRQLNTKTVSRRRKKANPNRHPFLSPREAR